MRIRTALKTTFAGLVIAVALSSAPVSFSSHGFTENDACAFGPSCVPEAGSFCSDGFDIMSDYRRDD